MVDHKLPISTLVIDDEPLARSLVSTLVRRDPELLLLGECVDGAQGLTRIRETEPDLLFLDIKMPGLSGVDLLQQLHSEKLYPYVVFVTAFDQYAIKAFELDALDYLVKPIEKDRFSKAVERAKLAIRSQEVVTLTRRLMELNGGPHRQAKLRRSHELIVRKGDRVVQLSTEDIEWLEAANQYVHIHTQDDVFIVSETLSRYSKRIKDPAFVRIHRSAMVNAATILEVSKKPNGTHQLRLTGGRTLVVSRSRSSMIPHLLRLMRSFVVER